MGVAPCTDGIDFLANCICYGKNMEKEEIDKRIKEKEVGLKIRDKSSLKLNLITRNLDEDWSNIISLNLGNCFLEDFGSFFFFC
jgi:hypothetical protein